VSTGAAIAGVGESERIGVVADRTALQLHAEAAIAALEHAGLAPGDVDGLLTCRPRDERERA
jgi:3-oxoacyl-[acyl-carrier-protein] synthase III